MIGTAGLFVSGAGAGLLAGATSCSAVQLGLLASAMSGPPRGGRPIGIFLGGRLVSHVALGAAMGAAGAAVRLPPQVRTIALACAAAALALFALDLLGVRWTGRLLRRRAGGACAATPVPVPQTGAPLGVSSGSGLPSVAAGRRFPVPPVWRAGGLGAATIFVPCGLTLSAEIMAAASRSVLGGAAVMAGFVLGTVPFVGLAGLALGRGTAVLRGRAAALAGAVLLVVAGWTLLSGLRLGGWLPRDGAVATAIDGRFVADDAAGTQVITIWALDRGYRPSAVTARPGRPTVLVVRTRNTYGCVRAFTVPARRIDRVLPVTGATRVDLGVPAAGRLRFTCATGHYPGVIDFRAPAAQPAGRARAAAIRARVASRPMISSDSNSGNPTVRPVTATRTGA